MATSQPAPTRLVFDLSYGEAMSAAEAKALARQLKWVISTSRRAARPFDAVVMGALRVRPAAAAAAPTTR